MQQWPKGDTVLNYKVWISLGMVAHTSNPNIQEPEMGRLPLILASLVYIDSSRSSRATYKEELQISITLKK